MARAPDPVPTTAPSARAVPGLWLVVAALAALAYWPALSQGFVLGDDHNNFVYNEAWRGLSRERLAWMWSTFHLGHWQPLTWMTFGAEYGWFGLTPGTPDPPEGARYHISNLALHAATAAAVYFLFLRLLERGSGSGGAPRARSWCAAGAALLWAVHPLRVENVAWATERRDLLSGLLLVATTLAYLRFTSRPGARACAPMLALYALSLCAKAWGMTLPAVLLVLDVFVLGRARGDGAVGVRRLVLEKLVFLPFALAAAWLAARAQSTTQATLSLADHGPVERVTQAAYGLVFYVAKTLVPWKLSTHYLLEDDVRVAAPEHLGSLLLVLAALVGLVRWRRRWPALLGAAAAYAILVSPVLGFLQSGMQKVADRYAYLALIPLFALLAAGLELLARRGRRPRALALVVSALLALSFAATWRQTRVWRSSLALFARAVQVEPDNYIAQMNYATALREAGRLDEAREHTERSIAADGSARNAYARFHLGLVLQMSGDLEGAVAAWRDTLAVDPVHRPSLEMAAGQLAQLGRGQEGVALFEASLRARPGDGWVRERLAGVLAQAGETQRARELWSGGLERDPDWVPGLVGLGRARLVAGQVREARELLARARALEPGRVDVLMPLGRALRTLGERAEAEACWRRVLELEPGHVQARALLERSTREP